MTAAESAQWHRGTAYMYRRAARRYQDGNVTPTENVAERVAAHHETAAEALDLLAELAATYPKTLAITLTDEHDARLRALVEGR